MADRKLRDLQRKAENGSIEDEALLLRHRFQVGDFECRGKPANDSCGPECTWCYGLTAHDRIQLASYVGHKPSRLVTVRPDRSIIRTLHHCYEWEDIDALKASEWAKAISMWCYEVAARACIAASLSVHIEGDSHLEQLKTAEAWCISKSEAIGTTASVHGLVAFHIRHETPSAPMLNHVISESARSSSIELVKESVQDELAPWALGERDPIRERLGL